MGLTPSFVEVARTKVGRSLGLSVTLFDTLGTSIRLIDSKLLSLGLKDESAERGGSNNGQELWFKENSAELRT